MTVVSAGLVAGATFAGWLPTMTLVAAAPGLLVAAVLSLRPPPPARLRAVGWTLVGASLCTAVIVVISV